MGMTPPLSNDAAKERRQRKKLQNRLNQRASRLRRSDRDGRRAKCDQPSYRVHRWRLDEDDPPSYGHGAPIKNSGPSDLGSIHMQSIMSQEVPQSNANQCGHRCCSCIAVAGQNVGMNLSLSADHLLHLIQFNALRGLCINKYILAVLAIYVTPGERPDEPLRPYVEREYPGNAAIPTTRGLPVGLHPTHLQSSVSHSTWINLIPFPIMRDNFIKWTACFDHAELVGDLVGNLIDLSNFFKPQGSERLDMAWKPVLSQGQNDEPTVDQNGLILWGEPHQIESWEVTPGFVRRWGWALEGCGDLIASTNRWRLSRGEWPLQFSKSSYTASHKGIV